MAASPTWLQSRKFFLTNVMKHGGAERLFVYGGKNAEGDSFDDLYQLNIEEKVRRARSLHAVVTRVSQHVHTLVCRILPPTSHARLLAGVDVPLQGRDGQQALGGG